MPTKLQISSDKLNSFTSLIRFWVRSESDLTNIDLYAVFTYWQEHGQLPSVKGTLATACPSALKSGPKPLYGELKIAVAEWAEIQLALNNRVSRLSVLKKALELKPDMYGGVKDPIFFGEIKEIRTVSLLLRSAS